MGLHIDTLKDLQKLLKQLKLEVKSLDELQGLLARINANDDPDAARERAAWRLIGLVAKLSFITAGILSFYGTIIPSAMARELGSNTAAVLTLWILGILWGGATLATVLTAYLSLSSVRALRAGKKSSPPGGTEAVGGANSAAGPGATPNDSITAILNDRTRVSAPRKVS